MLETEVEHSDFGFGPSMVISTFIGLALAYSIVRTVWKRRQEQYLISKETCADPPRIPYRWPFAIDLIVQAFNADKAGEILHFFTALIQATGPTFEQVILGSRGIDTIDPKNIEAVLSSQFHEFGFGVRAKNFQPLLGHGIFTQDGQPWKISRELLRPQFMLTRSENFALVQEEVEKLVKSLDSSTNTIAIDLQPHFFRLTLQTTMVVMIGRSYLESLDDEAERVFAEAFSEAQHHLARRGRLGDLYWLLGGSSFRTACQKVHTYVDHIVQSALAQESARETKSTEDDRYVFLRALMSHTKDPIVLRDQILNILLAGRDTTACLLSWTVRLLAQHQDVQNHLRQECLRLSSFTSGSLPTKAELKQMPYLDVVLREVLRLYPSIPVNVRTALKTTTLPRGGGPDGASPILIRRGEDVGYCVYAMHRSKQIYGPDADDFRPSRWSLGSNAQTDAGDAGWGYLPFNGGPRICLGREFALLEASYTIVRLMQSFKSIETDSKSTPLSTKEKHSLTLVLSSADGCNVLLTPVKA